MNSMIFLIYSYIFLSILIVKSVEADYKGISNIIIFGDTFSDDNSRKESFPSPYVSLGKRANDLMWPIQLIKILKNNNKDSPKLNDYAYYGAHANSLLTDLRVSVPDTRQQTKEFLSDLKNRQKFSYKNSESLIIWWIGINPIDAIWTESIGHQPEGNEGAKDEHDPLFLKAIERIDKQIAEVRGQIFNLSSTLSEKKKSAFSTIIFTIPDLTTPPMQRAQAKGEARGDPNPNQEKEFLKLLKILVDRYNQGLRSIEKDKNHKTSFKVYDLDKFWNNVRKNPSKYGITNIDDSCFGDDKKVCDQPDKYFFWDYLHPGPQFEKVLSVDLKKFIDNNLSSKMTE